RNGWRLGAGRRRVPEADLRQADLVSPTGVAFRGELGLPVPVAPLGLEGEPVAATPGRAEVVVTLQLGVEDGDVADLALAAHRTAPAVDDRRAVAAHDGRGVVVPGEKAGVAPLDGLPDVAVGHP